MSTVIIVIIAFLAVLIGLISFNYFRMKNMKPVAASKRIRILGNKNFKPAIRQGVTLVDFWAPWCGPCKVMAPVLNEVAENETRITVAKVNVDQNQQLAQKYKVRNIPTLILFRDGREINRFVGVKTKSFLMKEIQPELM
jgi:thioredoxin 1